MLSLEVGKHLLTVLRSSRVAQLLSTTLAEQTSGEVHCEMYLKEGQCDIQVHCSHTPPAKQPAASCPKQGASITFRQVCKRQAINGSVLWVHLIAQHVSAMISCSDSLHMACRWHPMLSPFQMRTRMTLRSESCCHCLTCSTTTIQVHCTTLPFLIRSYSPVLYWSCVSAPSRTQCQE